MGIGSRGEEAWVAQLVGDEGRVELAAYFLWGS
jgi:hypothetical protein